MCGARLGCPRGVDEGGLTGLARGVVRGAAWALFRPLAAALDSGVQFAESIRSAVSATAALAAPHRPPRCITRPHATSRP